MFSTTDYTTGFTGTYLLSHTYFSECLELTFVYYIKYLYSYTHNNIKYLNAVYIDLH